MLLGLVPASSGSVAVGHLDLADLDADTWRTRVAWVPQRPHLFARSIADNVRLGSSWITDELRMIMDTVRTHGAPALSIEDPVVTVVAPDRPGLLAEVTARLDRGELALQRLVRAAADSGQIAVVPVPTGVDGGPCTCRVPKGCSTVCRRTSIFLGP